MRGEREGGGRKGLRKVETDVSPPPHSSSSSNTHPTLPSRRCIPVQTVSCLLVLQPSSISLTSLGSLPCMHVLQNINSPTFARGETAEVGIWVWRCCRWRQQGRCWWWGSLFFFFLRVRVDLVFCSVLLIRQRNQSRPNQPNMPLHTQAQTCSSLSCALNTT